MGLMTWGEKWRGIMDWWHLCDRLTVPTAALIVIGEEPTNFTNKHDGVVRVFGSEAPDGYWPVFTAIKSALLGKKITGQIVEDLHGHEPDIQWEASTVEVESLVGWLKSRGVRRGFLFEESTEAPDYTNPKNPRFSPRLAAAIKAWEAMEDPNLWAGKSPKQAMEQWLESNYKALELVHKSDSSKHKYKAGDMNKSAIAEAAKVANWEPDGGAPKTPERTAPPQSTRLPPPIKSNDDNDLDDEGIPF